MPDILIRNVAPDLVDRLKQRAELNGRSLQAEITSLLESQAELMTAPEVRERLADLRTRFAGRDLPSAVSLIREGRDER